MEDPSSKSEKKHSKKPQKKEMTAFLLVSGTFFFTIFYGVLLSAGTFCGLHLVHRLPGIEIDGWLDLQVASLLDSFDETSQSLDVDLGLKETGLTVFNPEGWHGASWMTSSNGGFFEGWYYKLVTESGRTIALIPGVIYEGEGGGFAFVMIANPAASNVDERVRLLKYNLTEFSWNRSGSLWSVTIGPNVFGPQRIELGANGLVGTVDFKNSIRFPSSILFPDVMGWFAWLPGLECRHGIVDLNSETIGELNVGGEAVSMVGGAAYIEKDWGSTFPKTWVWLQSNHFKHTDDTPCPDTTLMVSVASIPFPSDAFEVVRFRGFLGFFSLNSEFFRFSTYTGAKIEKLEVVEHGKVVLIIRTAQHRLTLSGSANSSNAVVLYGPAPGGKFVPFVREMLDARFDVTLTQRSTNTIVFSGVATRGGLETESLENDLKLILS
eukprot:m.81863 g.81863  ORF g.81863 m.81863 type:complete len:437 (+) comp25460_c1_seq1:233-1543(+)